MWEFIDKVVYINLDHREDRRELMKIFFEKGNIPPEKIVRFSAIRDTPGIIGAAKSHIQVLKLAKINKWNNILVFEDDLEWVDFEENYNKLESLISTDTWDVCMLGGHYIKTDSKNRIFMAVQSSSYIVKSTYYDPLISNFETGLLKKLRSVAYPPYNFNTQKRIERLKNAFNCYNVDVYWIKLQLKDTWIGMIEPMCKQIELHSDNKDSTATSIFLNNILLTYNEYFKEIERLFNNDVL